MPLILNVRPYLSNRSMNQTMSNTDWLTLVLVLITGFYAWATQKILRANEAMVATMRSQQDAALRPYIEISIHWRTGTKLIYLTIRNAGKTAAARLKLSINKDFYQLGNKRPESNLRNSVAFRNEIDSLPPNGELLFLLGNGPSLYSVNREEGLSPLTFNVSAKYSWGASKTIEISSIDLRPYINTDMPRDPIAEELNKVKDELKELKELKSIRRALERLGENDANEA